MVRKVELYLDLGSFDRFQKMLAELPGESLGSNPCDEGPSTVSNDKMPLSGR